MEGGREGGRAGGREGGRERGGEGEAERMNFKFYLSHPPALPPSPLLALPHSPSHPLTFPKLLTKIITS